MKLFPIFVTGNQFLKMKNRVINSFVDTQLKQYPILVITGPRQSGKTTFLKEEMSDYRYISLEDPDVRSLVLSDPKAFLKDYDKYVIFDEVQQAPELFSYLQTKVDKDQIMGQYILSGSQNFNLMESISQSLAGRVSIFKLMPFDMGEMKMAGWLADDLSTTMTMGFYPAIFQRGLNADKYYANYVETYINRDVSQLQNIQDKTTFKRFMALCADRAGQLLNYNELAKDTGISHTTARNWLSVLETSFITYPLGPYHKNYNKRMIKSPKLYFYDTGLLCYLLGIRQQKLEPLHPKYDHIFENLIVSEMHKQNFHRDLLRDLYFWRDSNQNEVDLLYSENGNLNIYEIKSSTTIKSEMFKFMDTFSSFADEESIKKTLIYGGNENQHRTNYEVISWRNIFV